MPLKLIYTSAPRLLQAGRSGLGTVAMSRDIPKEVVKAAENFSQFSRQPGMEKARVVYSYRTVRGGDGIRHVLSCVRDAGADYSGRTNHLAEHLIFDDREAQDCAAKGHTPAGVLLGTEWRAHDGYCGWIDNPVHWESADPAPTWEWWKFHSSSAECRHNLCTQSALRGAVFAYGKGLEKQTDEEARQVLCLFSESQQECANRGWGITFTTNVEPNDELSDFRWIGVPDNSPMISKLESLGAREWVTLETPPPARPAAKPTHGAGARTAPKEAVQVPPRSAVLAQASRVGQASSVVSGPPPVKAGKTTASSETPSAKKHARTFVCAAVGAVVLLGAFSLSQWLFASPEFQFEEDSLKVTYNGGPQAVRIITAPPQATVAYAKFGTGSWQKTPPIDAGRYMLRLEVPGWFGTRFGSKVISRNEELLIEKLMPIIHFPEKLDVDYDGRQHKVEPRIETLPLEVDVKYEVLYTDRRFEQQWTDSPPRNHGEYDVRVTIADSANFHSVTRETTFRINKPSGTSSAWTSSAQADNLKVEETKEVAGVGDPPPEVPVVFLPQRNSLKLLSELADLPAANSIEVKFRKTAEEPKSEGAETPKSNDAKIPEWKELKLDWRKSDNGLPSEKPTALSQEALEYQISNEKSQPVLRVLELANGSGAAIQKLFETGPFYLERTALGADAVRLAPQTFFGGNLNTLPNGAYFEVAFDTKKLSVPNLEFRKSASGWEAELPTQNVTDDWDKAKEKLLAVAAEPSGTSLEALYRELHKWATRHVKKQDHEAAKQILALQPNMVSLGENATSLEVIKAIILDITTVLDRYVPLSEREANNRERQKGEGAGDEALKSVKTHLLAPSELPARLDDRKSDNQLVEAARGWINGRLESVGTKDQDKPLRALLSSLGTGFSGTVPKMAGNAPTNTVSAEDKEAANRLRRASVFLDRLGVASPQPDSFSGQLSFVYDDNGQTERISLGSIRIQPSHGQ